MRKTASQIADQVLMSPTKEMTDHFLERTNHHIALVRKYCSKLEERVPGLGGLKERSREHDQSKFGPKEKLPYTWLTWRYKRKDDGKPCVLPTGVKEAIDEATEHHILTNAHHPEFHQSKRSGLLNTEDRDKPPKEMIDSTKMSKLDIAEMVADWCAMSEERGNTPHEWAKKNVNVRWKYTPEQEKHILKLIDAAWDKHKTASQLGDEVLEKLSIDLATLRRVSSDVLRRHGVRGGMGVDLETGTAGVFRNPHRAGLTPMGPTLSPEMAMKTPTGRVPVRDMRDLLEAHPRDVYHVPAPILSGGGRGTTSDALSSPIARQQDLEAPKSPQGKEMLNRVGLLHENFERQALGRGLSVAQRGQNWGEARLPSALKDVGMIGGGHISPRVILREHNVLSTLPRGTARDEVLNSFVGVRALDRSWNDIHKALKHPQGLRYGQQRLSRHAIRRIEDLVRQGG